MHDAVVAEIEAAGGDAVASYENLETAAGCVQAVEGAVAAQLKSRRPPSIIESFNFAFEGIIHVLRTQRNMRIHFAVAALVLIAALVSGVDKLELIALLLAIAFVLIAEMLNTAVEAAIDVATTSFDPMAKLAKDIAAGAVLIATAVAVAVGYLVFSGQVADRSSRLLDRLSTVPAELTLVALVLTTLVVIATKAFTGSGTPLRGGLPSGHAAVAFAGWMAVTLILDDVDHRFLISSVTFIMALARGPDPCRIRCPLLRRGPLRRPDRRARRARRLPGRSMTELVEKAEAVAARAYAPYSNYNVGAVVRTDDGREFEGVNVENAAYPLGVCAEKSALVAAVVAGYGPGRIAAIGINASPCGGCRQWLAEFRIPEVSFRRGDGTIATYEAKALLPETWDFPEP